MSVQPASPTRICTSVLRGVFLVWLLLAAGCLLFSVTAVSAEPKFPELTGRVVDNAGLLSAAEQAQIISDLEALEAESTDQLVVVTLPSLQGYEIEDFGYQLGRHWGIGQKNKDNGVLLIVAPNERKVRIEVGRGLEPLLTDALTRLIIENGILPRFRTKDFSGGIAAGVSDIIAVLRGDAEELKARALEPHQEMDFFEKLFIIIWFIILFIIILSIIQSIRHGNSATGSGKKKGSSDWTWGSGGSSGGGWSSGGGGFSGGGGGFGGGGSSGGW